MKYSRVYIQSLGYVLPPVVVSSDELEEQIEPVYSALHMSAGQLEALTGIYERRWWESDHSLGKNAAAAAQKALENARVSPEDIGALIYGGVNRENFEPATACHVASELGLAGDVAVYDLCNACLGVFNGVIEIANQIELGHIRAGLVVSSETAREINDVMIDRMLAAPDMDTFTKALATLRRRAPHGRILRRHSAPPARRRQLRSPRTSRTLPLGPCPRSRPIPTAHHAH